MRVVVEEGVRCAVDSPAVTATVVGVVAFGRNDPIVPFEFFETDKEALLAAVSGLHTWDAVQCTSP